jgi:glycine betaine catabolism A
MNSATRIVPHSGSRSAPTSALPQHCFTSEEWHRRDLERVFSRRWLFAGHTSQIPNIGDFFTYEIDKESIVVARGEDLRIRAFHNSCRHRGSRICTARAGNTKVFVCPYHQWTYGLDGHLVTARLMKDVDKSQYSAVPVWVEEWNGMVFLNLSADQPSPVAEHLKHVDFSAFCLDQTRVVYDKTYALASNWKLAAETYNECYHCAGVHREMVQIIDPLKDLEAWDDANGGDDYVIFTPDMTSAVIKDGARTLSINGDYVCKKPLGNGRDWLSPIAAVSWFPQFGLFVYPDRAETLTWIPVSPGKCLFRSTWSVHKDAVEGKDYTVEGLIEMGDLLNSQDGITCETAQRGIESSGYRPGPYHPIFEAPLRGFNRLYLQHVS